MSTLKQQPETMYRHDADHENVVMPPEGRQEPVFNQPPFEVAEMPPASTQQTPQMAQQEAIEQAWREDEYGQMTPEAQEEPAPWDEPANQSAEMQADDTVPPVSAVTGEPRTRQGIMRRLLRHYFRKPVQNTAKLALLGMVGFGVVNIAMLQDNRHPNPLFTTADWTSSVPANDINKQRRRLAIMDPLIQSMQVELTRLGYYTGEPDGLTGPKTRQAIGMFMKRQGLVPGTAVDEHLLAMMKRAQIAKGLDVPMPPPVPPELRARNYTALHAASERRKRAMQHELQANDTLGLKPDADLQVFRVQRILAELGYAPGKVDGIYGNSTRKAIQRFELDYKFPVTGEISDVLLHRLSKISGKPMG